ELAAHVVDHRGGGEGACGSGKRESERQQAGGEFHGGSSQAGSRNDGTARKRLPSRGLTPGSDPGPGFFDKITDVCFLRARPGGCVLAEFRMAPLLLEEYGMPGEAVMEALLHGLRRSTLPCGLIVCGMRPEPPERTVRAARLAARYRDEGVVGFDLAGAELGFSASVHAEAFAIARNAGLGLTCHAGEAGGGEYVME